MPEADKDKLDLGAIEPLRPVEELEAAAHPGMTERERALEERHTRANTGGSPAATPLIAPGATVAGGPVAEVAAGGAPVVSVPQDTDDDAAGDRAGS